MYERSNALLAGLVLAEVLFALKVKPDNKDGVDDPLDRIQGYVKWAALHKEQKFR